MVPDVGNLPCTHARWRHRAGWTAHARDAHRQRGAGESFHISNDKPTAVMCRSNLLPREILGARTIELLFPRENDMKSIVLSAVMVGALSSVMLTGCVAYPGPAEVTIGWHGDRYWDGQRYWERHDWEARHPRGYDDRRDDRRDERRDERRDDERPRW
jgi:hypothetical protein